MATKHLYSRNSFLEKYLCICLILYASLFINEMLYFPFILLYIYLCLHFYLLCFLNIFASIPYLDTSWPQNEGELTSRGSSIQLGITFLIHTKRGRSNINSYVKTCFYINLWFNEFRFCNHQKGGDCWYKNAIYISQ